MVQKGYDQPDFYSVTPQANKIEVLALQLTGVTISQYESQLKTGLLALDNDKLLVNITVQSTPVSSTTADYNVQFYLIDVSNVVPTFD